jgi:tetratricopeptide (TPR) repeat protein
MQIIRIHRLSLVLAVALATGCAANGGPGDSAPTQAGSAGGALSIPEAALDALPLEHLLAAEFALREDNLDAAARAYLEAARSSRQVEIARRATRVNLAAQRWPEAAEALAIWRSLAGTDGAGDLGQAAAVLAMGQGNGDAALAELRTLLAPGGAPATRLAAGALEAAPDRGLAVQLLERLAEDGLPDDLAVLIGLSQLALRFEHADLAARLAERGSERMPEAPEIWFWRARLANAAGDAEAARTILEQAVATNPDNPDIRRTYAVLLKNELGDAAGAAASLAQLPPDDETLALRAAYAIEAGDWPQAAQVQTLLAALPQPRPPGRLVLLGGVAEALAEVAAEDGAAGAAEARRRRAEAATWYGAVPAQAGEDYSRALQRLAVLDQHDGRTEDALGRIAALREQVDPDSDAFADSFLLEAELLDRAGAGERALAALETGMAALPDVPRLRYARGLMRERMDQVDGALADFQALVQAEPDNPVYLNAYGYTLSDRTDRHDEALVLIERALALNPDDAATIDSMGWVLYRLGRLDEALVHLRRAYELQDDGEIAAHLGEVLWVSGRRDEARQVWRKAQQAAPENRVLDETIERFQPW